MYVDLILFDFDTAWFRVDMQKALFDIVDTEWTSWLVTAHKHVTRSTSLATVSLSILSFIGKEVSIMFLLKLKW
jgi:hypothetical protein